MRSISTDWAIAEPSPTKSITAWAPSPPVSSFTASTGSHGGGVDQVVRARGRRQLQRRGRAVDGDDLGRAELAQHLDRDVAESADADDGAGVPGVDCSAARFAAR